MSRILIIEDNADLAYGLSTNLQIQGYTVETANDGPTGIARAADLHPQLIVLDLMMPGMDGFEVLAHLRRHGDNVPVLVLTARGEEMDKVRALRMGADDYLTKPFGLMELIARVEALLRRAGPGPGHDYDCFGDIEVFAESGRVLRAGAEVELTPKEYALLLALLRRQGAVASRIELMSEVWGHRSAVISRTVDTHIGELRRKLEPRPSAPQHIITVRKSGYRLDR